jgi:hypothetical protein
MPDDIVLGCRAALVAALGVGFVVVVQRGRALTHNCRR